MLIQVLRFPSSLSHAFFLLSASILLWCENYVGSKYECGSVFFNNHLNVEIQGMQWSTHIIYDVFCKLKEKKEKKDVYFSKFQFANRVTFRRHLLKKVLLLRQYCRSLQNCLSLNKIMFFFLFFLIINVNRVGWDIGTTYDA